MKIATQTNTREFLEALYLDWFNNFGTVEAFANHHDITKQLALAVIERGKEIHLERFEGHTNGNS